MTRKEVASALQIEVEKRDEWYGLDNWSFIEIVDFVLDRAATVTAELHADGEGLKGTVEVPRDLLVNIPKVSFGLPADQPDGTIE